MSYESIKLATSPDLYYRLDQLSAGVNGESVIDLSGNDLHGELVFTGPSTPWGWPSPIETDTASRSFHAYGPFTAGASITRDSDTLLTPTGDFWVDAWFMPETLNIRMLTKWVTGSSGDVAWTVGINAGGRFFATLMDSANSVWTVTDPGFGGSPSELLGRFWYVVVVRLGDALSLYVNGVLRVTITITSSLANKSSTGIFQVGAGISGTHDYYIDEVSFGGRALSGVEIAEQYEAALFALNMSGQCDIRTSAVLSGVDESDPAEYSFRHNWTQPVVERFRWRTGVFVPSNGPTQLTRQRSSLRRQVEYQHLLYSEKLRRQFEARAFAEQTTLVQFEPDKVRVGNLSSSATSVTFDTRYRDFEVGQRVLIYQDDDTYEFQTLTEVVDSGVEWSEGLSRAYTRPWIKPARVARLPNEQLVEMQNDVIGDCSTIYEYLAEDESFIPRRIVPFTPTITYYDREVFDVSQWQSHNYSELPTIEYVSDRSELDDGVGIVSTKQYRSASTTQPYNMNLHGRELIARYLGWLYYRSGRYSPFWMPTFKQDLRPLARSGNVLLVEGHEYSNYYSNADTRQDLAFIYFDGSMVLRRIKSHVSDSDDDALSLDSAAPTLTGLRWLSFLRRVILSSDDVEIAWETDDKVRVAFAVVDAPIDIQLGSPSVSPSPSASTSTSTSPSASSSRSLSPSSSTSPSASISPTISPSSSPSQSASASLSPSGSTSPSSSPSPSV